MSPGATTDYTGTVSSGFNDHLPCQHCFILCIAHSSYRSIFYFYIYESIDEPHGDLSGELIFFYQYLSDSYSHLSHFRFDLAGTEQLEQLR